MSLVRRHPLISFFVLAFALSWGGWPLYAAGVWPIPFLAGGPLLAALIVVPLTRGRTGLRELGSRMIRWRVGWRWYAVALGLPLAVLLATVALNVALGADAPSLAGVGSLPTVLLVFAVRLIDPMNGPMGEEPGWRGFALPGLQTGRSPLLATLILAPVIAVWHLPLALIEGGGMKPLDFLGPIAFAFVATWLFDHTGGSVLMTIVLHAAEGTIHPNELWSVGAGAAAAQAIYPVVWVAVAIGVVILDWKFWRGSAPAPATTVPAVPPLHKPA
jgi:membrane protease YdiL (CAAX protease family)